MRYARGCTRERGRHGESRPRRKIKRERGGGRDKGGSGIGETKREREGERDTEKAVALDH